MYKILGQYDKKFTFISISTFRNMIYYVIILIYDMPKHDISPPYVAKMDFHAGCVCV